MAAISSSNIAGTKASPRAGEIAAGYTARKIDVVVTSGDARVFAAKPATAVIPIVIAAAADPVGNGVVEGLARPGCAG